MACGCPVAASRHPSRARGVRATPRCISTRWRRASIADALRRLLDDAALREDLRTRGRRRAALFTWDATAQALLDVVGSAT